MTGRVLWTTRRIHLQRLGDFLGLIEFAQTLIESHDSQVPYEPKQLRDLSSYLLVHQQKGFCGQYTLTNRVPRTTHRVHPWPLLYSRFEWVLTHQNHISGLLVPIIHVKLQTLCTFMGSLAQKAIKYGLKDEWGVYGNKVGTFKP